MKKTKILFVNEFSELNTGFAAQGKYLMAKLAQNPKYELAEMATYINCEHPLIEEKPWKVYPTEPNPRNPRERQIYDQNKLNQFGAYKFEEILLDFCPDIVISWRDPWMDTFIFTSPLRKNYKFIHMPTCDGEPQKQEWIQMYEGADVLLTYSGFGKNVLEKQSNGKLKVFDIGAGGIDLNVFKPAADKRKLRESYGIDPDIFIINTVMRNQPRKLYTEIFAGFVKFLKICRENGNDELAKKTYLHCHTSNPDVGWDIPTELNRHGIAHKVLFTYVCDACGLNFISFFGGDICNCPRCKNLACHMPNTIKGSSKEQLAEIMSMADLYLQVSVCEGYGLPINDAKACGVPVMALEHTAMKEQCYNGGAYPIKIGRLYQEPLQQTNQWRALPDTDDMATKIYQYFTMSESDRRNKEKEARQLIETTYTWDILAEVWTKAIESLNLPDQNTTWYAPIKIHEPNLNFPNNLSNYDFVKLAYTNILGEDMDKHPVMSEKMISALNLGYEIIQDENGAQRTAPVNRQVILNNLSHQLMQKNTMEQYRYNKLVNPPKATIIQAEV